MLLKPRVTASQNDIHYGCFQKQPTELFYEKKFLKISYNSQKKTCARVIKLHALSCKFVKKEALTQVFSCELCEIFYGTLFLRNTFFTEQIWTTASVFQGTFTRTFHEDYRHIQVVIFIIAGPWMTGISLKLTGRCILVKNLFAVCAYYQSYLRTF